MRRLTKRGTEQAMEMKFGKTGLACRLLQQNTGLVFGGEEIMKKLPHEGIILAFRRYCRRPTRSS